LYIKLHKAFETFFLGNFIRKIFLNSDLFHFFLNQIQDSKTSFFENLFM